MGSVGPQRKERYNFCSFQGIKPKFHSFVRNSVVILRLCKKKNFSYTCDLQTKVFQGHYLKHEELVESRNISLIAPIDTVHFVWYDYRDYMFNNIKSLPHAGDLQTKAFQGHYLKHKELVELRNMSLIDTVHFVWYDYRDYMFNHIKSLTHTGDLQTKAVQGHYLKHKELVE